ncbi:MAG: M56 family metallopeptidase [Gemmatimonadota bacterium]|nr:M56 family metallopeptidase [Gemmatimonadota bacterium]
MGDGFGSLLGRASGAASISEPLMALGAWAVPEFWLPVLIWTVWAAGGIWLLGRGAPGAKQGSAHPATGRRVAQVLLFMLPLALLTRGVASPFVAALDLSWGADGAREAPAVVASAHPGEPAPVQAPSEPGARHPVPGSGHEAAPGLGAPVTDAGRVSHASGAGLLARDMLRWLAGVGFIGVLAFAGHGFVGFCGEAWTLRRLEAGLERLTRRDVLLRFDELRRGLGVEAAIDWRVGPPGSVPMTFGFRRPVVALPPEMLASPRDAALAVRHELVHIKRHDYAWAWAEGLVTSLFSFHPLVRRVARDIGQARERSCDLEVVSHLSDPRPYGELLVHMAGRPRAPLLVAAGLAPSSSTLRERLESMTRFADSIHQEPTRASTVLTLAMGLGLVLSAACVGGAPDVPEPEVNFSAEAFTMQFGPMSDEIRSEVLQRLDLQVNYLIEQMEEIRAGELQPHARARYDLLESMYVERLEQYETLKMEAEVNRQLGVS